MGYATCLNQQDIPQLAAALDTPLSDLSTTAAGQDISLNMLALALILEFGSSYAAGVPISPVTSRPS